jgi:hypothetical protein
MHKNDSLNVINSLTKTSLEQFINTNSGQEMRYENGRGGNLLGNTSATINIWEIFTTSSDKSGSVRGALLCLNFAVKNVAFTGCHCNVSRMKVCHKAFS